MKVPCSVNSGKKLVVHSFIAEEILGDVKLLNSLDGYGIAGRMVGVGISFVGVTIVLELEHFGLKI
jgi:hypothetical protein